MNSSPVETVRSVISCRKTKLRPWQYISPEFSEHEIIIDIEPEAGGEERAGEETEEEETTDESSEAEPAPAFEFGGAGIALVASIYVLRRRKQ